MLKKKIFISSVQREFARERKELSEYLLSDPLLGRFFETFIFEQLPAVYKRVDKIYLKEVEESNIYLGVLGNDYGYEDGEGVSPAEREFDHATNHNKTRLVFLSKDSMIERHHKQQQFIEKAQAVLVRKSFGNIEELKAGVYASLVRY